MELPNIADIRKDYSLQELDVTDVADTPINQFQLWLKQAIEAQVPEPTAMNLATVSITGKPSARIVLLKGIEDNQFIFYTNYESRKGQDLAQNPYGALTFYWAELERQVRIEGMITRISQEKSVQYFQTRPRASQVGAVASPQSQPISSRALLEQNFERIKTEYENQDIPKPPHWGGYALNPTYFEFWQGRRSRLHDRIIYQQDGNTWHISRLAP